jgi:carboxyl-terminal processing protease
MASQPAQHDDKLYAEVYRRVTHFHLDEARPDRLTLAALRSLDTIDPAVAVDEEGGDVVMRRGAETRRFSEPPAEDIDGWGALTNDAVASARSVSPVIADTPTDMLDEHVMDAALATLDRFSRYVRPSVAREHRRARDGFIGVGVTVAIEQDQARVAWVAPDSSAAEAGVKEGDRLQSIDGAPVAPLSPDAIEARLGGAQDSLMKLTVARDGTPAPIRFTLRRETIVMPSVSLGTASEVAWLTVRSFNARTAANAAQLLVAAHAEMGANMRGIVLDLRGNPGGLLDQAVDLASLFIEDGTISSTIGRLPESNQHFAAARRHPCEKLPMVVLIDGGSASASEIVAAALQDAGRAAVVGTSSFGKGTVQTVFRTDNGGELTVTWAELLAPAGYRLDHHGVVPTVCTDGLKRADAALTPSDLEEPRSALDDGAWRALRSACPPEHSSRSIDAAVAHLLLDNPALYHAALIQAQERPAEARLPE